MVAYALISIDELSADPMNWQSQTPTNVDWQVGMSRGK